MKKLLCLTLVLLLSLFAVACGSSEEDESSSALENLAQGLEDAEDAGDIEMPDLGGQFDSVTGPSDDDDIMQQSDPGDTMMEEPIAGGDDESLPPEGVVLGTATDGVPFGSFSTGSVYGNEVTDAVFSEYAMTMVNVWATWCPPCIDEMNELEEVYQALPINVNVLGICEDGASETDLALQILAENGCNFDSIYPSDEIRSGFLSSVTAFPTTVFVDSAGNVFGEPIVGAPGDPVSYYIAAAEYHMELLS